MIYKFATKNLNNIKVESNNPASKEFAKQNKSTSKLETIQRKADASQKVAQLEGNEIRANNPALRYYERAKERTNLERQPVPEGVENADEYYKAQAIVNTEDAYAGNDLNPERAAIPAVEAFMKEDHIKQHIDNFKDKGAGKFDNPESFAKIGNKFDFGRDFGQFVGLLDKQKNLAQEAKKRENHGLWHMVDKLSAEPKDFIDKDILDDQGKIDKKDYKGSITNKDSEIILTEIPNPRDLAENLGVKEILKMPTGKEGGAIKKKFKFGGKTEGGEDEAVIVQIKKEDFNKELGKNIRVNKFSYPNTKLSDSSEESTERDITQNIKDFNDKQNMADNS